MSGVRSQGKKYQYKKEDLLPDLTSTLLPTEFLNVEKDTKKWNVNLTDFDLEVVLFFHTTPPTSPILSNNANNGPPASDDADTKGTTDSNMTKKQPQRQQHYLTLALNLRPYNKYVTSTSINNNRSWYTSSHLPPPDVLPPFFSLSYFRNQDKVVRLRPSTAQLLLELANVSLGDVVVDPCAGVGTIPIEAGLGQGGGGGGGGNA
eukprot:13282010-Ditylum_brightwellii.AAC.1